MSQENVETVRQFYEAVERWMAAYWRDPRSIADALKADDLIPEGKAVFELVAPDFVWNAGTFGTYRGHGEIARAWDDLLETVDDYRLSVRNLRDCGDGRVFAAVDRTAKARASGIHATFPAFVVITVRDGLLVGLDEYLDRAEALEAVGLRE
jgi:ketosteroid isomerase-like protein